MADHLKLGVATLVSGSESPAGDGVTGAQRCVIRLPDGTMRSAVLKRGTPGQITAECFCGVLLRAWNLDVPDPYLVVLEGKEIAFAGADVAYPSLKQRLGVDSLPTGPAQEAAIRLACELTAGFPSTPLAMAIDEAIDNRDRNLGNILWDGQAVTWIDHAFALGEGEHMQDANKLAQMIQLVGPHDAALRSAVGQALTLSGEAVGEAFEAMESLVDANGAVVFLSDRLRSLPTRIMARFPAPIDLLSPP